MAIPQDVYEHLRYGSGAKPGASLALANGVKYCASQESRCEHNALILRETWTQEIVVRRYPADFLTNRNAKSQRVNPSDVPTVAASCWRTYWTHEC